MKYLRTSEEIVKFCDENKIKTISIGAISRTIEENLGLSFLGYFHSILDDGFWTYKHRGGYKTQDNKFAATSNIIDFLINSRVFSDSSGEIKEGNQIDYGQFNDKIVKLFGKLEGVRVTELIAFNTGNYFESHHTDRTKSKSVDLWF